MAVRLTFTVSINAPVHTVFEYCRDPRRVYAGDPDYTVSDAVLTPEGVGTTTQLVAKLLVFTEDIAIQYVELVQDQRIVFEAHPAATIAGRHFEAEIFTWTWTFAPAEGGTSLTVAVVNQGGARWERALDSIGTERVLSKQIRGRLARIKAGAEEQATAVR